MKRKRKAKQKWPHLEMDDPGFDHQTVLMAMASIGEKRTFGTNKIPPDDLALLGRLLILREKLAAAPSGASPAAVGKGTQRSLLP